MAKYLYFFIFIFLHTYCFAAEIKTNFTDTKAEILLSFTKGYSAFEKLDNEANSTIIFTFDSSENIKFSTQEPFNIPIKSISLQEAGFKKKLLVVFKSYIINPVVSKNDKQISIIFSYPAAESITDRVNNLPAAAVPGAAASDITTTSSYVKMMFGLTVVLILIFILFWVLKTFFKKQLFSDIPGSGRLLGKVDLELRKSLYFYEIGDTIYIIGVTDNSINVIDKIVDEVEATKIRSGFIKKHDFKGYMSFFKHEETIQDELQNSNAIVEEKLQALKGRKK